MSCEDYKAYRQRWANEDQRRSADAMRGVRRFIVFVAVMVILAAFLGALTR